MLEDLHSVSWRCPSVTFSEAARHHQPTPEWSVLDEAHRIERTYRFKNFAEAYAFVQKVAELAESEGHHPDVSFGWGYVTVSLQTKKIKGLQNRHFEPSPWAA